MTMRFKGIILSLAMLVASLVPVAASAHSDITYEQEVGDHQIVMSFFGDGAYAKSEIGFNIYVYLKSDGALIALSTGTATVLREDGAQLLSAPLDVEPVDAPAYVKVTFPEAGQYTVVLNMTVKGAVLSDVRFPITVSPDPFEASVATEEVEETEQQTNTGALLVGVLVALLVIGGGVFLIKRRA